MTGRAALEAIAADEVLVDGAGADRLVLRLATFEATLYAVRTWHYSGCAPAGKLVRVGVWHGPEDASRFLGVVIFSRGASPWLPRSFDMAPTELVELTRVALRDHPGVEVSRILVLGLRFLRATNPGVRLVASFADPRQGHHGGIYQATNWLYYGTSSETLHYVVGGRVLHTRSVGAMREADPANRDRYPDWVDYLRATRDPAARVVKHPGKHRYLFPLDRSTRRRVAALAQPYPTREQTAALVAEHAAAAPEPAAPVTSAALARFRELYGARAAEASRADAPAFRAGEAGSDPAGRSPELEQALEAAEP